MILQRRNTHEGVFERHHAFRETALLWDAWFGSKRKGYSQTGKGLICKAQEFGLYPHTLGNQEPDDFVKKIGTLSLEEKMRRNGERLEARRLTSFGDCFKNQRTFSSPFSFSSSS